MICLFTVTYGSGAFLYFRRQWVKYVPAWVFDLGNEWCITSFLLLAG
jgi:hypothetical protein